MLRVIATIFVIIIQQLVNANNYYNNATLQKYGKNVCTIEEVFYDGNNDLPTMYREHGLTLDNRQKQTCGHITLSRNECCEGFKQLKGLPGCTIVKSPNNMLETIKLLGANEFARYAMQCGLFDILEIGGPYTLFVPTDEAFAKMDKSLKLALVSRKLTTSELIKYHVVPYRLITHNMTSNTLLETLNDGLHLRFNKHFNQVETINCVKLIRKNRIAKNGVVHLINTVLNPHIYSNRNLVQIINQNTELTIFSKMIETSRMHQSLKETFQTYTVLAPIDNVLRKLPNNQLSRILDDEKLSKEFILKHLLPTTICLSAITEGQIIKTLGDDHSIKFNCDALNSATTQGYCIKSDLKLTFNGILYAVNFDLSNYNEGKTVLQIMNDMGLTEFLQIVNIAGLAQTFDTKNMLTVFAPSNQAIKSIDSTELYCIKTDSGYAKTFVEYHIAKEVVTPKNIYDNKIVETFIPGQYLRLQCVQNTFGVEGQLLNLQHKVGFNGIVHLTNQVLMPSTISVHDIISKNNSFSIFMRAVNLLDILPATSPEFCGNHNTYFIPTNNAFKKLGIDRLIWIFNNPLYMRTILHNHQVERVLSTKLLKKHWQYEIQTKNKTIILSHRGNKLMVNNVEVIEADLMTTNGIVHVVDDLILPQY
ncbi:periostin isoform X1 [Daktulosphaira vitifoliae]|uniref:periostin isoform X1 n=1 Tax=Daktulosphaira vitifoliae TaxID=58002 RepID=UPI0021AA02B1|nr:periostin isoform X1 [Daktulosphaira vitifoliae]